MYCPNCGKQISDSTNFCIACGKKIFLDDDMNSTQNTRSSTIQNKTSIDAIVCPQCGSNDIDIDFDATEKTGTCLSCGTKIALSSSNVYNIFVDSKEDDDNYESLIVNKIAAKYTAEDFIVLALQKLSTDDSPLDVFDAEFSKPVLEEHIVLLESARGKADFSASIGYNREEPYQTTESYYDSESKSTKERLVTKYKHVIDWSPFSGSTRFGTAVAVDNNCDCSFNSDMFNYSYSSMTDESIELNEEEASKYEVNEQAHKKALVLHNEQIIECVVDSLPGDHFKDLDYETHITGFSQFLVVAPCYTMTILHNGQSYVKKFFPFGLPQIGGDEIMGCFNEVSRQSWKKMQFTSILTIALLALSIIISFVAKVPALIVISFIIAAILFVYNEIKSKKVEKEIADNYLQNKIELSEKKLKELSQYFDK